MSRVLVVFLIGLLVIAIVGYAYYAYVGVGQPLSADGQAWAEFGDYFGGVAATLLSFISILLLVYTVHLQSKQLLDARHEVRKRDLLAHVTKADDEVMHWLGRRVSVNDRAGESIEFGDVVWGILKPSVLDPHEFRVAAVRLHRLTCLYCDALALYRDNIDPHFIFKYHRQKAQSLLDFLKEHQGLLGQMAGPSLKFCQMHLDGEH